MLNLIDSYLNKITMYRLMLYYLIALVLAALVLCFFEILSFKPFDLIFSVFVLLAVSWITNKVFSVVFGIPANVESVYITALILALVITPPQISSPIYFTKLWFLVWVSILAMACKYILAYRGKHIFNPAAFAVALTALTITQSASWWVGTLYLMPFVLVGGLLVARKIQRFDLVLSFLAVAFITTIVLSPSRADVILLSKKILFDSPILFFAFVMLTEPLTTPPTRQFRFVYGIFVGFLFAPLLHIGSIYSTPELALLSGNILSYLVSPKGKYLFTLKSKTAIGSDTYDLGFSHARPLKFRPGQYLEWTLGHKHSDNRGNRRYFTIASSPTEQDLHLGVKFYNNASSFKSAMFSLNTGSKILAGSLSGEFTLPENQKQKLVFIAGGIGITPYRSMLKYLLDRNEKRDITLFYSNKTSEEIAYKDILDQAEKQLDIKTVYILTNKSGYLTGETISNQVPDYKERLFYISGPRSMVAAFEDTLRAMGIPKSHIKIDFFPGFV